MAGNSEYLWPYDRQRLVLESEDFNKLSLAARYLWRNLWLWSDADGKPVHPSYTTLSRVCGCSRRHVFRLLNELESAGYIQRQHRSTDEKQRATTLISFRAPLTAVEAPSTQLRYFKDRNGVRREVFSDETGRYIMTLGANPRKWYEQEGPPFAEGW